MGNGNVSNTCMIKSIINCSFIKNCIHLEIQYHFYTPMERAEMSRKIKIILIHLIWAK